MNERRTTASILEDARSAIAARGFEVEELEGTLFLVFEDGRARLDQVRATRRRDDRVWVTYLDGADESFKIPADLVVREEAGVAPAGPSAAPPVVSSYGDGTTVRRGDFVQARCGGRVMRVEDPAVVRRNQVCCTWEVAGETRTFEVNAVALARCEPDAPREADEAGAVGGPAASRYFDGSIARRGDLVRMRTPHSPMMTVVDPAWVRRNLVTCSWEAFGERTVGEFDGRCLYKCEPDAEPAPEPLMDFELEARRQQAPGNSEAIR